MTVADNAKIFQSFIDKALAADKQGHSEEAIQLINQAIAIAEQRSEVWIVAAYLYRKIRQFTQAIACYKRAIEIQPLNQYIFDYSCCLVEADALSEAEAVSRQILQKTPKDCKFLNLLGVVLKRQQHYEESLKYFDQAAKLTPNNASAFVNMGNVYIIIEKPAKAAEAFQKATKLEPKNGEHLRLLASSYSALGNFGKALSTLQAALLRAPHNPQIRSDIATIYFRQNLFDKALVENEKAILLFPADKELKRIQGVILRRLGRIAEAEGIYKKLLEEDPNDRKAMMYLANLYCNIGDRERANAIYERAWAMDPTDVMVGIKYSDCLINSRYGIEAEHIEKSYQIALSLIKNNYPTAAMVDNLKDIFLRCVDYDYTQYIDPATQFQWREGMAACQLHSKLGRVDTLQDRLDLVKAHAVWGVGIDNNAKLTPITKAPALLKHTKIRIGLMSSDLRRHPVTYFAQPIIERYDRSRFELYCYSFYPKAPDEMQQYIAKTIDRFHVYDKLSDIEIAQNIANDELDILFELGGCTLMNKAEICAFRPAPVQVSWLGYPHSLGLKTIDYIMVDPYINPDNPALLVEKPFVMPETWVSLGYLGFYNIPIEEGIPEDRTGHITFGTMNNPYKYTLKQFEVWSQILQQVENSHFLFVRPEGAVPSFRKNILGHFAKHGIEPGRIEFIPVRGQHMPNYNRIDIALDSFPHTGGTTTCETLWMGVPAVALIGEAFFERLSYSNLSNAGLGDLCARTTEEYIKIAVQLAGDKERRRYLRHHLRQQIRQHPLGQEERFVRNFEAKIVETLEMHKEQAA